MRQDKKEDVVDLVVTTLVWVEKEVDVLTEEGLYFLRWEDDEVVVVWVNGEADV